MGRQWPADSGPRGLLCAIATRVPFRHPLALFDSLRELETGTRSGVTSVRRYISPGGSAVNINKTIRELIEEKKRLDPVIGTLEELHQTGPVQITPLSPKKPPH